jgi:hypothetical protein
MRGDARAPVGASTLIAAVASFALLGGCSSSSSPASPAVEEEDAGSACPAMPTPRPFVRSSKAYPRDGELRVNHVQALATHNSYHRIPPSPVSDWLYEHAPLPVQLESQGVRGFELDIQWDPSCERFRVFHIGIIDELTTCAFLTDCLVAMRGWSEAHPGHHPIFVQIEPKNGFSSSTTDARLAAMEREILAVFERLWLVTPDDVKRGETSVSAGLAKSGWPTLGEARGRFVFFLNDRSSIRDAYTAGRRHLDGRLVFAEGGLDEPFVAVQVLNDPVGDRAEIDAALARGVLVRTRADSNPRTVREGSVAQREAALTSGAQIISTDFPVPPADMTYAVTIPGGTPSRCAPGVAPSTCTAADIEDPSKLAR